MRILWIVGALAIASVAGALLFLERKIRLRHRRVLLAAVTIDASAPRVFDSVPMRHLGTRFADELPVRAPWAAAAEVDVFCTAQAVFCGPHLVIPIAWVDDAAIVSGTLRLRWRRGSELLETSLQARAQDLENLRREIHLRQANVAEKLAVLVQQP